MDEKEKITDDQLLDILEEQPDITQIQMSELLGISQPAVSKRIRKLMEMGLISDKVQERVNRHAFKYIKNLEKQSDEGDTPASVKLLEIAKVYTPKIKRDIEGKEVIVNIINYGDKKKENSQSEIST